jgi:DNA repair protein RadC
VAGSGWLIKELAEVDRPRERLLREGGDALADEELLAVLIRIGRTGASAVQLAGELLRDFGGLAGLLDANVFTLQAVGLGPAKKASLLAAVEIGRRLARLELLRERDPLRSTAEVVRYLSLGYRQRDQEIMGALFLDTRNRLMGHRELFRGTLDRAAVEPREILKECLLRGAAGVILFHTHPSGDPSPSAEDILFTRRMAAAGEVVGVTLLDHLVLGAGGRWVSLRQKTAW